MSHQRTFSLKDLAKDEYDLNQHRYELLDSMGGMCLFELHSICKDKQYTYQHLRDLIITPEIIPQEILCDADIDTDVAHICVPQKRLVENENPKGAICDELMLIGFNGGCSMSDVLIIATPSQTSLLYCFWGKVASQVFPRAET